jgi:cellulose synthase/poly-beta-1,6-N-acetylglucosamine synthase-like glycosyltransferase
VFLLTTIIVLFTLSYTLALFVTSRRKRPPLPKTPDDLHFVFMIPCLDEALVIGRTLEALLSVPSADFSVIVIDDGSQDRTADIARSFDPDRVRLFQRVMPEAQKGKGEALNAAYRWLRGSPETRHLQDSDVITVIIDADGRIEPNALFEVGPYFADPEAAAVQIGVRMHNISNLLTRLQDFEFVTFTEIFQRGRQRLGSIGLGGNGQFARLKALESLGDAPWTDCLTEDLDLGIRLRVAGWNNYFCPTTHVSQQAVPSFRRLIRQRSRWFHGHMQCWQRIPLIMRSRLPGRSVFDLIYHLSSPSLVLVFSLPVVAFFASLLAVTIATPRGMADALISDGGVLLFFWYMLSFGLAPFYGFVYWLRTREKSLFASILLAHVFNLYSYMWFAAGWMAVGRVVLRRRGWAKTERTEEIDQQDQPGVTPR